MIQGCQARASNTCESHTFMQYLTTNQDNALVAWISEQEKRAFAPSYIDIREMVEKIIQFGARSVVIATCRVL
ncbi:hypothetical protein C7212DRAFT_190076 [Tuber magnatum]|uniref:Uncharacterized protein n=1 Tax=Tuber magnatum TaxID=42249 RepID=A0A317SQW1_9PEZI|nr:hypothetical protein C7212DRAFT_190076 [Tuber magnatum]